MSHWERTVGHTDCSSPGAKHCPSFRVESPGPEGESSEKQGRRGLTRG